jgi:hypothetical protein
MIHRLYELARKEGDHALEVVLHQRRQCCTGTSANRVAKALEMVGATSSRTVPARCSCA